MDALWVGSASTALSTGKLVSIKYTKKWLVSSHLPIRPTHLTKSNSNSHLPNSHLINSHSLLNCRDSVT